jgi:glycosyltransferase involved in cell wall biosynthesis
VKIRVLEVLASLRRAGAERVAVSLACGLDRTRFETEVVSLYDAFADGFEPVLADAGVAVRHLGKHRGLDFRMVPRLARAIGAFRPAIVHTHSYVMRYALPAGWWAARPHMVHTVHNLAEREVDGIGRMVHRAAFRAGAAAVAVSGEVAKSFRRVYGFDPAAVIPNGIDLARFAGGAGDWRQANGFAADDGLIVSVARLEPQKNPLRLIEAFARGLKEERHWRLLLAGGGSLEQAARDAASRLGVAGRVHFLGVRTDIAELLAACDLFALAADWEGSPMAVIEAMASGLPVVATAVGGVPELVKHGATGLLIAPGDTAALAQSLAALARDAKLRAEFGARARERAAQFGDRAMIDAYAQLFERVAGGGR